MQRKMKKLMKEKEILVRQPDSLRGHVLPIDYTPRDCGRNKERGYINRQNSEFQNV